MPRRKEGRGNANGKAPKRAGGKDNGAPKKAGKKRAAPLKGKGKGKAPRATTLTEFNGAAVVAAALQGSKIKVHDDVQFLYESLGGGIAAQCALRILGVKAQCALVTAGAGSPALAYQAVTGKAAHVICDRFLGSLVAPCCLHGGKMCAVSAPGPAHLLYVCGETGGMRRDGEDGEDGDDGTDAIIAAIEQRKPQYIIAVTAERNQTMEELLGKIGYATECRATPHAAMGSPLAGKMCLTFGVQGRHGDVCARRVVKTYDAVLSECPREVRHVSANLKRTRKLKRTARGAAKRSPEAYLEHLSKSIAAANKAKIWKVGSTELVSESERASTFLVSEPLATMRSLVAADVYQAVGKASGEDSEAHLIADVGSAIGEKRYRCDGFVPQLGKRSVLVSFPLMHFVEPGDVAALKGLKFDKVVAEVLGKAELMELACAEPSAVALALATVAVAIETGHAATQV